MLTFNQAYTMKKIFILLSICSVFFSSCKKDFDPQLYGVLSTTTFPSTASEYEAYMMELYKPFQATWGYSDQSGNWENQFFSPEYGHIVEFDMSTDLMPVYSNWGGFWQGFSSTDFTFLKSQGRSSHFEKVRLVTSATKIISDLQKASVLTESVKKEYVAEARMARGWTMYYLLHMYGPVPVILNPDSIGTSAEANLKRPSRSFFVDSIAFDLRYAANNLPLTQSDYGRFTKGTALTVLMRLYLNEKDFVNAEKIGREIVSLGIYSLVSDYASLFKESTEQNNETIWAVSCSNGSNRNFNALDFYTYPTDYMGTKIKGGWGGTTGVFSAAWSFYDSFDSQDVRRKLLIASYTTSWGSTKDRSNMNGAVIAKYADEGGDNNSLQGNDIVVCRYADVLLMLAEAINENSGPTQEAADLLNQIRTRAGVSGVLTSEKASKDAFRDALFAERGKELYLEGLRKFDLIRMGKVSSALAKVGKTPGSNYNVFPIPSYAINNSNGVLTQNEGY
jgi:hypothetical protein